MANASPAKGKLGAAARFCLAVAVAVLVCPTAGLSQGNEPGLDLTSPIRQQLRLLQDAWQEWIRAYYQDQPEEAGYALERLQSIAEYLGMSRLPDLSVAAAAFAVRSAQEGNFVRAAWALDASRQLDPDRPETAFASSVIERLQGSYPSAVTRSLEGYRRLFELPLERSLWLHHLGVWGLYLLLLAGAAFVALQMFVKGGALFYDLARLSSPPLARVAADVLTLVILLWPLVLPAGGLWLVLYWSILLWGYGSVSERVALIALWVVLGATPLVLSQQQRAVQATLIPPARLLENLAAQRLYGSLFSDLGILRSLAPESQAVREVVADVHRSFGQWEYARSLYNDLVTTSGQSPVQLAPAMSNIGTYHQRKKEYSTAVGYFKNASESNPQLAEAFYNLSQAYNQLYEFPNAHQAMARARELDGDRVRAWFDAKVAPEESTVAIDGGIRRADEILAALGASWRGPAEQPASWVDLWRRHLSLTAAAAAILLAMTLHLVRRQQGYRSSQLQMFTSRKSSHEPWVRALVPGLASACAGRGGRAFAAILVPVALLMVPLVRGLGYRTPLGYDPGHWLPTTMSAAALFLWLVLRLVSELRKGTAEAPVRL